MNSSLPMQADVIERARFVFVRLQEGAIAWVRCRSGMAVSFISCDFLRVTATLLNSRLEAQLAADGVERVASIEWLDFPFRPVAPTLDGEILSVDFLSDRGGAAWRRFWPDPEPGKVNRRGMPSWDAVGQIRFKSSSVNDWLLVEAKAHTQEFASPRAACGAAGKSRQTLQRLCGLLLERLPRISRKPGSPFKING